MSAVHKKLMQARIELHGLRISKSGRNEFAKYNYMELGDFLIPTQEIFARLGLCGLVSFTADIATLTIVDVEDGSQVVVTSPMGSAALKGCHEVQNIGAVETYQRRYLWVTAMEIVEHDALDSSKPITDEPALKAVKVQGGLTGIGDDLSQAWKTYLEDTAKIVSSLVNAGKMDEANAEKYREPMDEVQELYMERFLDSKVRSALRKHNSLKAA